MKTRFLFAVTFCFAGSTQAVPAELPVPRNFGLYVADLSTGRVRALGNFYDWKASPDGRYVVGGREIGSHSPFYEVSVISTLTGKVSRLERYRLEEPGGAGFRWSSDSARVRVEADRNNDGKSEFQTFVVGRSSASQRSTQRTLSPVTRRKLKARYADVGEVAFSPNAKHVVAYLSRGFYQNRNYDGGFWTFRPDGSGLQRLTRNTNIGRGDFDDREAVWLDNHRLAFRRTSFEDEGI